MGTPLALSGLLRAVLALPLVISWVEALPGRPAAWASETAVNLSRAEHPSYSLFIGSPSVLSGPCGLATGTGFRSNLLKGRLNVNIDFSMKPEMLRVFRHHWLPTRLGNLVNC